MTINKLSQRDPKWKNNKLGTSNTTIGDYGCTITSLAMLSKIDDVQDVNQRLIDVNGFAEGNLLIWSKIEEAIPWMKHEGRYYSYQNDKVKMAIEQNGGCLVEVNGAPIGGSKHWVLYIGGGKLYDPWDGQEKPTSAYQATGFDVIKRLSDSSESEDNVSDEYGDMVYKSSQYDEVIKSFFGDDKNPREYPAQKVIDEKAKLDKKISDYAEKEKQLNQEIKELNQEIKELNLELAECEGSEEEDSFAIMLDEIEKMEPTGGKKITDDEGRVEIEISYKA